jgi:serine/threonine protein kinase
MVDTSSLTLGKSIGSGCFGEVFAGLYQSKTVAIKRIQTSHDPVKTQSFLQEISAMETLKHENVVRLYAIAIKAPYTYIVTEFCKLGSLQDVLDKHAEKLTTQIKLDMMKGAAAGMAYIHSKGFAHRDLKLSNMLVTSDLTLKIADLGTATTGAQVLRSRVGTPDFCAPEILDGQPYTKACDIYSYAICVWVLFSGQPLYPGMTFVEMISKIVPGYRPDLEPIQSLKLRQLISQCWHKDPDQRPSFQQIQTAISTIEVSDFSIL